MLTSTHADAAGADAAQTVSWLDDGQVRTLFKKLLHEDDAAATEILKRTPRGVERRICPGWRDALLDALEVRISPTSDDPDAVVTEIIPRYAEFAEDLR